MTRTLALVFAHPDDESYSTYGTVARYAGDPTFRLVVLHATDGEGGEIAPGVPATREGLGAWRRQEDENAWRALGRLPDRHDWLGYPDGGLAEVGVETLGEAVAAFLRAERPDVVATFGPEGVTGHPDHIAISEATTSAFHQVRGAGGPGLSRLVYGGIRQSHFERNQRWLAERGWPVWDPTRMYHLRGTPDELFGIVVDNRPFLPRILAAIKEHRSQRHVMFHPDGSDEDWMTGMRREDWIIAWPPRRQGAPVLNDLFANLTTDS
jgi:LmbE family N-acetylglucosaminyl deacetylase